MNDFLLVIKADRADHAVVFAEAQDVENITVSRVRSNYGQVEIYGEADPATLAKWYFKRKRKEYQDGYPLGTLLYFAPA